MAVQLVKEKLKLGSAEQKVLCPQRIFRERLLHEAKLEMLEIPQATMNEFQRGRRGGAGIVAALGEHYLQATGPPRRARRAVNAVTDNRKIEFLLPFEACTSRLAPTCDE